MHRGFLRSVDLRLRLGIKEACHMNVPSNLKGNPYASSYPRKTQLQKNCLTQTAPSTGVPAVAISQTLLEHLRSRDEQSDVFWQPLCAFHYTLPLTVANCRAMRPEKGLSKSAIFPMQLSEHVCKQSYLCDP